MELDKLIEVGFMALISGLLSYISHSIVKLNNQVATILERTAWHKTSIHNLDVRVTKLEEKENHARR